MSTRRRLCSRHQEASYGGCGGGKLAVEGAAALRSPSAPSSMSFLKLLRHLANAEPGVCGHVCLRLSVLPGGRCLEGFSHTEELESSVLRVQQEWGKNRGNCTIFVVGIFEQYS